MSNVGIRILTRDGFLLMIEMVGTSIVLHEILSIDSIVLQFLKDDGMLLHIGEHDTLIGTLCVCDTWLLLRGGRQDAFLKLRGVRRDLGFFFFSLGKVLL